MNRVVAGPCVIAAGTQLEATYCFQVLTYQTPSTDTTTQVGMADKLMSTNDPSPFSHDAYDFTKLPDYDHEFLDEADLEEFAKALSAPDSSPVVALNDWRPIHQRVRRKSNRDRKRKSAKRSKDEIREGFVYTILKWPLLGVVFGWIVVLGGSYLLTRLYIYLYERGVSWRGRRQRLRRNLQSKTNYADWVAAAEELDAYLGNNVWKETDDYAYYDSGTVRRVLGDLKRLRREAEADEGASGDGNADSKALDDLRRLLEACVKNNFVGIENPRLYSETYYGTKNLVQDFVGEVESSINLIHRSQQLTQEVKHTFFQHLYTNYGRTALCFSGGASFAYYHFGVVKALLDADQLPEVITGTSGGALVAALVATRTDPELKKLLVPALAGRITACQDSGWIWLRRWYRTGARFDSLEWARKCSWFCHGSLTFREAYERTGRILNVSCVPSDPHSPTILANYLTSPDCVIWSAVLASAAVPGILNPVVLMMKTKTGTLAPYSFGHKWKDGSLRTDIPLKALNLHFNVNFSIVSQVNPHINLFFFSSRGTVGRPVTHRRGRGWRGGFLGSATEQYLKLDLNKWLKVLRHLELLPRPLGQDWSEIWLQRFSGTITIWPKTSFADFYYILSDPSPERLAKMIRVGQQSTFPRLMFIANRTKIERMIEEGLSASPERSRVLSEQDLRKLVISARAHGETVPAYLTNPGDGWSSQPSADSRRDENESHDPSVESVKRRSSMLEELSRQSRVFYDDLDGEDTDASEEDGLSSGEKEPTKVG